MADVAGATASAVHDAAAAAAAAALALAIAPALGLAFAFTLATFVGARGANAPAGS